MDFSISTDQSVTRLPDRNQWQTELDALPSWLRRPIGKASEISTIQRIIKQRNIHTICEEGRCPNRGECYSQKTATFLLMGPTCTRSCAFCQVDKGHAPIPLDPEEPLHVAQAVSLLGLRYVVLTSVARDDLPDGGAGWFVATMNAIRQQNPDAEIEVLTADFWGGEAIKARHPATCNANGLPRWLRLIQLVTTTISKPCDAYRDECAEVLNMSDRSTFFALSKS